MRERIQAIINNQGLTPSRFADIIGVQRSGISHILSGRNKPSLDFLNKVLIHFPQISGDWLITGNGEMLKNKAENKPFKQLTIPGRTESPLKAKTEELSAPVASNITEIKEKVSNRKEENEEKSPVKSQLFSSSGKKIERILVFYDDKTFREYSPE